MQAMLVGADTVSMMMGLSDMVVAVVSALVAVAYVVVFKYVAPSDRCTNSHSFTPTIGAILMASPPLLR